MAVSLLLFMGQSAKATTYYVRPIENTTAWNNIPGASIYTLAAGNAFAFDATYTAADTYYFAAGLYTASPSITIIMGKLYGGFSGNETEIDLNVRATTDKDGNGTVEPWEFANETIITGNGLFATTGSSQRDFITVIGGEINGITLQNHNYSGATPGTITLGLLTNTPTIADDIDENKGKMTLCTVKQLKSASLGTVMFTNKNSVIDRCLIEECVTTVRAAGSVIYLPIVGGQILNSVIRNNIATGSSSLGAIYATTSSTNSDNGTGNMNVIVQNCVIYNNSAVYGSAVRAMAQTGKRGIQIINCTFANNKNTSSVPGYSSVDLQGSGTFVNSIVVNDAQTELRPATANGYISNSAYEALYAGTSANIWPGNDMAAEKVAADFYFMSNSSTAGAMISGLALSNPFVQADYDAIRKANFNITAMESVALTTAGLKVLPTNYLVGGSGASISHTASIPSTDILGVSRPLTTEGHLDLGAYQYSGVTGINDTFNTTSKIYAVNNGININDAIDKMVKVYSVSGQMIKSIILSSNNQTIPASKGIYIVKVNSKVVKVIVK